ncbi:hypothetical protein HanRHA438_Chr03g0150031 [Helianthus annuus]|nr:hypothetical protein HanRHA438_Chr03g0150031 [Helianthus annuus]
MSGSDLQTRCNIKRAIEESIVFMEVVVAGYAFGNEAQLRVRDMSLAVVLKRQLKFGKVVEQLAGYLVEEKRRVAIVLGRHSNRRTRRNPTTLWKLRIRV